MTVSEIKKFIKVFFHCLIRFHALEERDTGKHYYCFCGDCDYGVDDDFIKVIKKIWKDKNAKPN